MDHDLEHCDSCWTELEASQIGLCDSCQGEKGVIALAPRPTVEIPQAAFRDASFFSRPDTRFSKKAHIVLDGSKAACGLRTVLCDKQSAVGISKFLRCQRKGCYEHWPAAIPEDKEFQ
ncbi:hypothetical protein QO021_28690 (plasmid) [Pseudomonas amygdali pv. lachrymans]|uniref:hypothetical protein n=1 Tax=Pseudomonas amygdali TaxID=47877 RepID=UPI0006B98509|nr:hypothetical protein [Pseudomonas amygdali]RMM39237.1 hypothetical protein ALQ79_200671 [Pseudomonas amygdali pv. lachrymans]WIO61538.1 hypothetical protein QO021_28690 [Pseudomonas amygdali pv. lachrymans]